MADNATPKPSTSTPPTSPARNFEFVLEMSDRRNSNFIWPLDQRSLRGRWSKSNLTGVSMDEKFAHMPDLPGLCLHVSTTKRTAVWFDPLSDQKNKQRLEKAVGVAEEAFGSKHAPEETVRLERMSDDDVKSYCYWARRFLDNRQCVLVTGSVPSMDEVENMIGMISFENHDTSANVQKLKDKAPRRYVPIRHEEEIESYA